MKTRVWTFCVLRKIFYGKKEINKPEITVETFNRAIRTYQREDVSYLLAHGILKQVPEDEKLHPVISRKTSKKNVYIGSAIACALVLLIIVGFAFSSGSGKNDNDTVSSTESVESTQK